MSRFSPNDLSEWFWSMIAQARRDRAELGRLLTSVTREELIRFCHEFEEAAVQLTDAPYTDYMAAPSEDDAQDVADWVVSQGKDFFSRIWACPEELAKYQTINQDTSFTSVADNVFWQRFRESMPPIEWPAGGRRGV